MEAALIQLGPIMLLSLIYAVIVYITARKRGVNPWPWVIGGIIPIIGMIVSGIFFLLSFLSILDRLNALEKGSVSDGAVRH